MENTQPKKESSFLRNVTIGTLLAATAAMSYGAFKADSQKYDNKPAIERRVGEAPVNEEDNSGTYLSVGLAIAYLTAGTWAISRFVKKPWLAYTVANDYLARRKQSQEHK